MRFFFLMSVLSALNAEAVPNIVNSRIGNTVKLHLPFMPQLARASTQRNKVSKYSVYNVYVRENNEAFTIDRRDSMKTFGNISLYRQIEAR